MNWNVFFERIIQPIIDIGIDEYIAEDEARRTKATNYLGIISALLLSPFPFVFLILNLEEGLYLCAIGIFAIVLPFYLNHLQYFIVARFFGATLGLATFLSILLFFGYKSGFMYGIISIFIFPIVGLHVIKWRLICYSALLVEMFLVWLFFGDIIPFFEVSEDKLIQLNIFLFTSNTILIISYFLSVDWIRLSFEQKNKQLVEKLILSNEELKNFSYTTSHDLKQPLRTILNFINLFKKKKVDQLDKDSIAYLNFIEQAGNRLNNLIDALLAHSVLGKNGTYELFDCNHLVQEVLTDLNALIEENNAQIQVGVLPSIFANRQEIGTVFQNLISNAIKFRQSDIAPNVLIQAAPKKQNWEFLIRDNGVGIPKSLEPKIFQIFQKGHTNPHIKGTGIGLANCKKIVNLHSGEIWVESQVNQGSTFYFTIKNNLAKSH